MGAANRVKLTKSQEERFSRDLATPVERRWLDAWEREVNPMLSPSIVNDRTECGGLWILVHLKKRIAGSPFGTYLTSLAAIKEEVSRERERIRQEEEAETERRIGAFI